MKKRTLPALGKRKVNKSFGRLESRGKTEALLDDIGDRLAAVQVAREDGKLVPIEEVQARITNILAAADEKRPK